MEHLLRHFACLTLSLVWLSGAAPALAETGRNADFFLAELTALETGYDNVEFTQDAVAVGDTLYIRTDRALYRWKGGMEEPESLLAFPPEQQEGAEGAQPPSPSATADPLAELTTRFWGSVSRLLTDGRRLLVLWPEEGSLWQLTDPAGALAPAREGTLDFSAFRTQEGEYSHPEITDIDLMDGWLYLVAIHYEQSDTPVLYRWELTTGKAGAALSCQITSLAPYKDGQLLCFLVDQQAWMAGKQPGAQLATFDPITNAFGELGFPGGSNGVGLAYNLENNTAYYMEDTVVYSLPGVELPAKKSAYMINRAEGDIRLGLMEGGLYYQAGYEGVSIRALDLPGMEKGALSLYGVYYSPAHMAFASQHPEIPTALSGEGYNSLEAFAGAMVSGQDMVDVLRLDAGSTPIKQLIDKGYALDLSGNADVMAAADAMYPALVEGYRRNGKLYALPVDMYASSLGYFQATLGELGLTREDLPGTWMELLDFMANWQEDYGEDNPGVLLADSGGVRDLLPALMESYVAYSLKTCGKIDFDAPLFARLMKAYDAIDFPRLEASGEDAEGDFWSKKYLFSFYTEYTLVQYQERERMKESWQPTPLPLPLDQGLEIVIPANQSVMIINPRTFRPDQAQLYLSTIAHYYDKATTNITLFPEHNDPVPNPGFEQDRANVQKELELFQKVLETAAPEEIADFQAHQENLEAWLANADDYRYAVRPEAIAWYRENIAPCLYPVGQTPLNTWREGQENEFHTLIGQYMGGAIPLERFIKEMVNRVRMMELESQ